MLLSPRINGLDSLFKEVRVFKVLQKVLAWAAGPLGPRGAPKKSLKRVNAGKEKYKHIDKVEGLSLDWWVAKICFIYVFLVVIRREKKRIHQRCLQL